MFTIYSLICQKKPTLKLQTTEEKIVTEKIKCYHCGDECPDKEIKINDKYFCCNGCKTVYEILEANNLCNYYSLDEKPGVKKNTLLKRNYDFLEDKDLINNLIDFTDGKISKITFIIPQMHCSSCIWILENLYKLDNGVIHSEVNFLQKKVFIKYKESETSLKNIVELLDSIGYEPDLNLQEENKEKKIDLNKKLWYKIGVAGFCFGNIMLLSFPEYLSFTDFATEELKIIFGYINIVLALPVFFYSASEYYLSALKGLRKKIVNIDVPITIGISVLFFRSIFEILTHADAGYLDSLAGLVFFLLIGKLFQNKTYDTLNFERNYKSYFPIAVTIFKNGKETTIPVEKLITGQRIIIKNNELIPADSVLIKGSANIDYSFVTGESTPEHKTNGELIYAGGRQIGSAIEVETIKEISQSYLTQLWNNKAFDKNYKSNIDSLVNSVSKNFTAAVISIALISFFYWLPQNFELAFNAFTAVLIIACPCALALSTPFTLGSTLRIFGRNKFYLKNTHIIEKLSKITNIVFDKTGTITESKNVNVSYVGNELSGYEKMLVKSLVRNSSHPLSGNIYNFLETGYFNLIEDFKEITGKGIVGTIDGNYIKVGSAEFVSSKNNGNNLSGTKIFISINNEEKGFYKTSNQYRKGLKEIINSFGNKFNLFLLSGDNDSEKENLKNIFNENTVILFKQSPQNKLDFINGLQQKNKKVLMIGDGLNDAGALRQSDVGITVSENINNFSPACDGILEAESFIKLKDFIKFSSTSKKIIIASFVISFLYNFVGLSFAVQGTLSPIIAAILMPISSITIVVFTTFSTNILAKRKGLL